MAWLKLFFMVLADSTRDSISKINRTDPVSRSPDCSPENLGCKLDSTVVDLEQCRKV
jgi:hypothetical protein